VKKLLWGNLNSKMFSTYLHLVDSDIERVIAEKAGIITKEDRSKTLETRQCPCVFHGQRSDSLNFMMRADANSLKEAADKVMQAKTQKELQPEFQAMMDRFRGGLLQMQKCSKTVNFRVILP
jgi:hypothetical protein